MKFSKQHPTIFGIEIGLTIVYFILGYFWMIHKARENAELGTEFSSPDMKGIIPLEMSLRLFENPLLAMFPFLFPFIPFIFFFIFNQVILVFTAKDKI
jgi:hypothetical protein